MCRGVDVPEARGIEKATQLALGNHTATYEGFVELDAGHHLVCGIATVVFW